MGGRREAIAMTGAEVADYLAARRTMTLVTVGPDGLPDPVPMWYVPDGDAVLMRTYAKSQKVVNLRRDARAVGLVEDGERYHELRGVQLTGRVELFDDVEAILDVVTRLAARYEDVAAGALAGLREAARPMAAKQVGLRLVPARVVSWDHRKLGGVY